MAIIPLHLARVSNNIQSTLAQRSLTQTQRSLLQVQNQLATGRRLTLPSDNPSDAALAQQLRKTLEQRQGFAVNLQSAASQLGEVDTTLATLTDLLRDAQGIASANVGSIVSADERAAAATVVTQLYNQALELANRQFNGTYLFAGDRGAKQPYVSDLGGVRFVGSSNLRSNRFDESSILPFTVDGAQVFGALSARVAGTADLTPRVTAETRLSDLGGATGDGIRTGTLRIGNGTDTALVDLSSAHTLGDVINAITAAGLGGITAAISSNGDGIELTGDAGDDITVADLGGTIAGDLGIRTSGPAGPGSPVTGLPLAPTLTPFTQLADLRNGQGIDQANGLVITNGAKTVTLDLSSLTTVEDLINAINSAGVGALAQINSTGAGIEIYNTVAGLTLTIGENGGSTAADLGIRSFSPDTPLAQVNGGRGVRTVPGSDLLITRGDGSTFEVDLSGLSTIQEVIDAINAADGGGGVVASFATIGNGIILTDGGGDVSVARLNHSFAIDDLGLDVPANGSTLTGRDINGVTQNSLLADLANLRDALLRNDTNGITLAAESLQGNLDQVVRIRGQAGAQLQDLENRFTRLEDQNVATISLLSALEDTDYNEAIIRFQSLQTALQANLQTTGQLLNLSLLDFLR